MSYVWYNVHFDFVLIWHKHCKCLSFPFQKIYYSSAQCVCIFSFQIYCDFQWYVHVCAYNCSHVIVSLLIYLRVCNKSINSLSQISLLLWTDGNILLNSVIYFSCVFTVIENKSKCKQLDMKLFSTYQDGINIDAFHFTAKAVNTLEDIKPFYFSTTCASTWAVF